MTGTLIHDKTVADLGEGVQVDSECPMLDVEENSCTPIHIAGQEGCLIRVQQLLFG